MVFFHILEQEYLDQDTMYEIYSETMEHYRSICIASYNGGLLHDNSSSFNIHIPDRNHKDSNTKAHIELKSAHIANSIVDAVNRRLVEFYGIRTGQEVHIDKFKDVITLSI